MGVLLSLEAASPPPSMHPSREVCPHGEVTQPPTVQVLDVSKAHMVGSLKALQGLQHLTKLIAKAPPLLGQAEGCRPHVSCICAVLV